jgi:hypothetical protein
VPASAYLIDMHVSEQWASSLHRRAGVMWQIWSDIHALMTQGAYDEALAEIAIHRDECRGTFSPLFVLEAACVARHGQPKNYARAAEILQEATGF